jgi:S-adenosylmethionine synthetase
MNISSFTSESVCAGHPDKICDAISDTIVDAAYAQDSLARIAVETLVSENLVVLAGEVTTKVKIDYQQLVKQKIAALGYTNPLYRFTPNSNILVNIHQQSPEIAVGVDHDGAGDQGIMFGYACDHTKNYMPLPIELAHRLTRSLDSARESGQIPYLRPDGKAQVTVRYSGNKPVSLQTLVLAVPHLESISQKELAHDLYHQVVLPVINEYGFDYPIKDLIVNGTGAWHLPGPASDTGVTGRKIVVDTYGGYARVGGGAFSGKDATKVDRSGAYAARYIAKNIVAHKLASECEVGLAYYIGGKQPVMTTINTYNSAKVSAKALRDFAHSLLDLSVSGIIHQLNLNQPIYQATSAYGHFGRPEFPWEKISTTV